ncbi:Putative Peroxidase 48 [Apostasia shenzhenica]|uniref:Peroxidase n=1 Tax=Apostasia shenzhenica TaxID=1088818 RepID=A0A2I0AP10_9ASPA|nr:Putative Peroxidase 48 [Apostasia shenzhenica]
MREASRRWGPLLLAISLFTSLGTPGKDPKNPVSHLSSISSAINGRQSSAEPKNLTPQPRVLQSNPSPPPLPLEYDFYRDSCPQAEGIIQSTMSQLYSGNSSVAPAGCDGSVLLGRINGSLSERDAIPNQTLKGFEAIDAIKSRLEAACPATVSCADVMVLAARNAVVLVRKTLIASNSFLIPCETLIKAASLTGSHSIGSVSCRFILDRLYNFSGTGQPDGSLDEDMLEEMRAACTTGGKRGEQGTVAMGGRGQRPFDGEYFRRLLLAKGIMRSDQQLTAGRTVKWVRYYADEGDDARSFRGDLARALAKLFSLSPGGAAGGEAPTMVRRRCYEVE